MKPLKEYRSNVYSQNGEDGVIKEIFRRLQINEGEFVEFGAWDGIYLSNTYNLLESQNWSGVYIEGNEQKFTDLVSNMSPFGNRVSSINSFVGIDENPSLDSILSQTRLKKNFELLSIDIDSYDFQIWESLKLYEPLIVIIEINSLIPVGIRQIHEGNHVLGSSFSSVVELGHSKDYVPICHTGNLVFAKNELVKKLQIDDAYIRFPEKLFDYTWIDFPSTESKTGLFSRVKNKLKQLIRT